MVQYFKMVRYDSNRLKWHLNFLAFSSHNKSFRVILDHFDLFWAQIVMKYTKGHEMIQNGSKWFKILQNGSI